MRKLLSGLTLATVTLAPAAAFAHAGHGENSGFIHGFMHPIAGLDHILAMVTVGILAYQIGGRALWLVPASFLAVMAAGGLLGVAGVSFYFVEPGIAASVVVLSSAIPASSGCHTLLASLSIARGRGRPTSPPDAPIPGPPVGASTLHLTEDEPPSLERPRTDDA